MELSLPFYTENENNMPKDLHVGKSSIEGVGLFANKDFKKGDIVFIFKGKPIDWEVSDEKSSLYGPNWVGIGKSKWLDVIAPGIYINHSCNPNCGIKGKVSVTALRNIKKGEEILIDYAITEIDKLWHMDCNCGDKNCRKIIRSIQYLPKKIYSKYAPYIPTYFMKVYKKSNDFK